VRRNLSSFIISLAGFVVLVAVSFYINGQEVGWVLSELSWFYGTIALFAIWPIESALFTFLPSGILQHILGAAVLAGLLLLTNLLQTGGLSWWSKNLAVACVLWPIGYMVYDLVQRKSKSVLLGSIVGWLTISILAVGLEFLLTNRLTWSLPLAILLAFWPAASIAFPPDSKADEGKSNQPEYDEIESDITEPNEEDSI